MRIEVVHNDKDHVVYIKFDNHIILTVLYEEIRKYKNNYMRYWEVDGPVDGEIEYQDKEVEG